MSSSAKALPSSAQGKALKRFVDQDNCNSLSGLKILKASSEGNNPFVTERLSSPNTAHAIRKRPNTEYLDSYMTNTSTFKKSGQKLRPKKHVKI